MDYLLPIIYFICLGPINTYYLNDIVGSALPFVWRAGFVSWSD